MITETKLYYTVTPRLNSGEGDFVYFETIEEATKYVEEHIWDHLGDYTDAEFDAGVTIKFRRQPLYVERPEIVE